MLDLGLNPSIAKVAPHVVITVSNIIMLKPDLLYGFHIMERLGRSKYQCGDDGIVRTY